MVKVLRVLFLLAATVAFVILLRTIFPGKKAGWKRRLGSAMVVIVIGLAVSELLVGLWMAQSGRYYRKLIHAYIAVTADEDKALT